MADASSSTQERNARRLALVTGASGGIGAEFARQLAARGYDLILVARSRDRMETLAKRLREEHGGETDVLAADLTQSEDLRLVERRIDAEENLELLVNNAGVGTVGPVADADADREEEEIRLNVVALCRLTRSALPGLLARKSGTVINVSSLAGLFPAPYNATYAATKAFVNSFTEALHEELRGSGVTVQLLCPGFIRTGFQERAGIDPGAIPSFAWMEAPGVVKASLEAHLRGDLICVPGLGYRGLATLSGLIPRGLLRRAAGLLQASRLGVKGAQRGAER